MPLVKVLKATGFEQVGDIVSYRGVDLAEKVAAGELELLEGDPRPVVNSQTPTETPVEEITKTEEPETAVEETAKTEEPETITPETAAPESLLQKIENEIKEVAREVEGK